jgi:hypothetical protein
MSEKGLSIANIVVQLKLGIGTLMVLCWGVGTQPKHVDHWAEKPKLFHTQNHALSPAGSHKDR